MSKMDIDEKEFALLKMIALFSTGTQQCQFAFLAKGAKVEQTLEIGLLDNCSFTKIDHLTNMMEFQGLNILTCR